MNPSVLLERVGGVSVITLNRPDSKNALDPATVDLLIQIFRAVRYDDELRAVVLTGAGSDFCAGGDVKLMDQGGVGVRTTEQRRAGMTRYRDLVVSISSLDKPVIAAVDGVAYGGGLSLALLADIVLVSDRVRMAMVFHRIGLVPDIGAWFTLPRIVGLQRAKELIFSTREFDAAEALKMNLALEVHPPSN